MANETIREKQKIHDCILKALATDDTNVTRDSIAMKATAEILSLFGWKSFKDELPEEGDTIAVKWLNKPRGIFLFKDGKGVQIPGDDGYYFDIDFAISSDYQWYKIPME